MEHEKTPEQIAEQIARQVADPLSRIGAEMISPYPPGVPAILAGERLNRAVADYLPAGVAAGMVVPDSSGPKLDTLRVVW